LEAQRAKTRFGTRTRRYLVLLWLAVAALEVGLYLLANRTYNSWFLLLVLAMVLLPLAALDRSLDWLGRPRRKRWKRHDVEAGLVQEPEVVDPRPPES